MAKKKDIAEPQVHEEKGLDLRGFRKALDAISSKIPGIVADVSANQLKRGVFLDSPQLTFLFGGKYPTDRIMQLQGPESSGKSTISNYIAGQLQKKKPKQPVVVYVDYERTFDPVYAERLGLDTSPDKFILLHPECGEDGFEAMDALVRTGSVCCMILDSDAAMPTRSMTTDEYGKACVSPDTLIKFRPNTGFFYRTGTMLDLFKKAGFGNFEDMEEGVYLTSPKGFYIKSFDLGADKKAKKKVLGFVYKGMAKTGYRVTSDYGSFLATGDHLVFDAVKYAYVKLKDCAEEISVIAADGTITTAVVSKVKESFPILDIEVEGTEAYFSGGILSHNTFGGTAKLASDALKRINILLNKYDTNLIWISQERASMEMYGSPFKATGGNSVKYFASIRNRVTKLEVLKDGKAEVGIQIKVRNLKNKTSVPWREAVMNLYFDGGFQTDAEYVDFLMQFDIVQQKGAYFYVPGVEKGIQGKDKLIEWLDANPDQYDKWKVQVLEKLSGALESDVENVDPAKEVPGEMPPVRGSPEAMMELAAAALAAGVDEEVPPDLTELTESQEEA